MIRGLGSVWWFRILGLLVVVGCLTMWVQPFAKPIEIPHQVPSPGSFVTLPPVWKAGPVWEGPAATVVPTTFFFPQIMGAGCALFDFDRDGDLDIYLIQGAGARPAGKLPDTAVRNRLLRQVTVGKFEDISRGSGLDVADIGMGVAIGDINNDGWPDVFLSNYGADRLLLNQRNGKFLEISKEA